MGLDFLGEYCSLFVITGYKLIGSEIICWILFIVLVTKLRPSGCRLSGLHNILQLIGVGCLVV